MLKTVTDGHADEEVLGKLQALSEVVRVPASAASASPRQSGVEYDELFHDEYLAHVRDHRCPGGVCKALMHIQH